MKIKKIIKPLIITIIAVLLQAIFYYICRAVSPSPNLLQSKIDDIIPFNIYFVVPYTLWYALLFIMPLVFFNNDKKEFIKYILAYILCFVIADIIYLIYPTTIVRPEINPNASVLTFILNIIYQIDTPAVNCMPSLHCTTAFLWILFICKKNKYSLGTKITTIFLSLLIIISTLFIKQHVLIDIITAFILSLITYLIVSRLTKTVEKINSNTNF